MDVKTNIVFRYVCICVVSKNKSWIISWFVFYLVVYVEVGHEKRNMLHFIHGQNTYFSIEKWLN